MIRALVGALYMASACSSAGGAPGTVPGFIPKSSPPVHRIVEASAAQPRLAVQGDTVHVAFDGGRLLATTVGPAIPASGLSPGPPTTPVTFYVTLADASTSLPIDPSSFTITDQLQQLHHPRVLSQSGALPTTLRPGQKVTLELHDEVPVGGGEVHWAPEGELIVAWDFAAEVD